jgi:hypothetical protein
MIHQAVRILAAAATFTRILEPTILHLRLTIGTLLAMAKNMVISQKLQGGFLRAAITHFVDFLVAIGQCSLTGESMNFGSGVVTNICGPR